MDPLPPPPTVWGLRSRAPGSETASLTALWAVYTRSEASGQSRPPRQDQHPALERPHLPSLERLLA